MIGAQGCGKRQGKAFPTIIIISHLNGKVGLIPEVYGVDPTDIICSAGNLSRYIPLCGCAFGMYVMYVGTESLLSPRRIFALSPKLLFCSGSAINHFHLPSVTCLHIGMVVYQELKSLLYLRSLYS